MKRPQAGDVILGCTHRPDPYRQGAHVFSCPEDAFKDFVVVVKFLFLCDACFAELAPNLECADRLSEVELLAVFDLYVGCAGVWPVGAPTLASGRPS